MTQYEWDALVEETVQRAGEAFGNFGRAHLELYLEPEVSKEQLYVVITTPLNVREAEQRLQRFEQEWWLKVKPKDGSIAVELRCLPEQKSPAD